MNRDILNYITLFFKVDELFKFRLICKDYNNIGKKRFEDYLKEREKINFFDLISRGDRIVLFLFKFKQNLNLKLAFKKAILSKDLKLVKFFSNKIYSYEIDEDLSLHMLFYSSFIGDKDILDFIIKNLNKEIYYDIDDTDTINHKCLQGVIKGNHKDLIEHFMNKIQGKINFNYCMYNAILSNSEELIEKFKNLYKSENEIDYEILLHISYKMRNKNLIQFYTNKYNLYNYNNLDWTYIIEGAIKGGDVEVIKDLLKKHEKDYLEKDIVLFSAIKYNIKEIVHLLYYDYNTYIKEIHLNAAILSKNLEMVKFVLNIKKKYERFTEHLELAKSLDLTEIVNYLKRIIL